MTVRLPVRLTGNCSAPAITYISFQIRLQVSLIIFHTSSMHTAYHPPYAKIHLVMGWPNILQISLWKTAKPAVGDIFTLLRNEGISSEELKPFKASDINDIFPWLYYGKRFDILRRLCHIARRKVEDNFKKYSIAVECHIIAEDTKKIVASTL